MGKQYIVKEKSGCGCGTIFIIFLLICVGIAYWQFFVIIAIVALTIWYFKYYPQQKARKQHANEVKELEEMEKKIALENRKLQIKNNEVLLQNEHKRLNKTEWKCSYCLTIHSPIEDRCHNCGASKE